MGTVFSMFTRRLVLLAAVVIGLGSAPTLAQDATPAQKPTIRIAIEGAYPPFNFIDANNELQGFEVDLLKSLCDTMKVTCELVQHGDDCGPGFVILGEVASEHLTETFTGFGERGEECDGAGVGGD